MNLRRTENADKFVISINQKYTSADEYNTREDAEEAMIAIMNNRNLLEHEYREFQKK